ncbi:ATP-dependent Clp protease proteolytic subunit [Streptomyces sp. NPDC048623]|uniref:ClpP family protease n=1 Tax=Streptomyces sp. NPDC048623 TaxID=3155761 RepID=UPI00341ED6AF
MTSAPDEPAGGPGSGGPGTDPVLDRLLRHGILHISEPITAGTADRVTAELLLLAAETDRPATLYINSPGGSVPAGMAIYDVIRHIPNDVVTIGLGYCASMAQFLVSAGTPGKRYALPNARMMLHLPAFDQPPTGTAEGTRHEELRYSRDRIADLLADFTHREVAQVVRDFADDRWLTPAEALEYGLIDRVLDMTPPTP